MTKILLPDDQLSLVRVSASIHGCYRESRKALFPDWRWYRWSPLLYTPDGAGTRPDALLLSESDYSWIVVEVELAHHSISGHIEPQLDRIRRATYDSSLADTILKYSDL